jgi:hypothetical protein
VQWGLTGRKYDRHPFDLHDNTTIYLKGCG